MAFISLLVMTRYVADQYGVMIWGLALVSLVNTVADMGFNSANLKFIAKKGYDQSACFSTYMVVKAILTVIMVIITIVTVYIMESTGAIDQEAMYVCLVFVIYQIISNIQFSIYYTLDGMMKSGKSAILTIVECSIRNAILIIMALFYVDAVTLSSAYVVATAISGVLSIVLIRREGIKLVRPKYLREYTIFAMPLAAALILTSVVSNLDKVIVGLFFDSIEVTFYSTAVGLIATFTAIGVSLNNVLLPHLSKNIAEDAMTERTLWALERCLFIILCPFIAFFIILGPEVAEVLFGDIFSPSGQMIAVLSVQIIPFVLSGIMTQVLYAINKGTAYLRASTLLCIFAVIGFIILIPDSGFMPFCMGYGGIGAAASVVIAYIIFAFMLMLMVKKYTNFRIYPKIWKILLAFVLCIGSLMLMDHFIEISGLILLAITGIICEAVFVIALYLMKEINERDIRVILRKMKEDED